MVFAKTSKAAARLSEQLREGNFTKKYLAITHNAPPERSATLTHYLLKNERLNKVEIVGQAVTNAKRAQLTYTTKTITNNLSLLEITLQTGRSHQIRVQLSYIGAPIVGDVKYGPHKPTSSLALWAHELSFTHPTSSDRLKFIVNPPETPPWDQFDFNRQSHKTRADSPS